jgi:uncharacterized protein involved in response to NO
MGVISLGERPNPALPPKGLATFALGFRPFFSLAALSGLLLMLLWLTLWQAAIPVTHYGSIGWHSHEMLFGYAVAVIAGFLLTAVRNWTGIDTLNGTPLALLAILWLLGRLAPFVPAVPQAAIVLLDLSFLPLLAIAIFRPLMDAENRINRVFLPLLIAMAIANLLVHLESLGISRTGRQGVELMINLIVLLMIMVSGRVLPFFTEKAINGAAPRFSLLRERLTFTAIGMWIGLQLFLPIPWLLAPAALAVAITQTWRLTDWHHPHIWRIPILWVLFTGMIWLVVGFLLKSLAIAGLYADNLATHAITAGAIGVLTFGMMARVSLGHTGRQITPSRPIVFSFILLNLSVLARVFGPAILQDRYPLWILLSGIGWASCYLLFTLANIRLLNTPRIDGRKG